MNVFIDFRTLSHLFSICGALEANFKQYPVKQFVPSVLYTQDVYTIRTVQRLSTICKIKLPFIQQ